MRQEPPDSTLCRELDPDADGDLAVKPGPALETGRPCSPEQQRFWILERLDPGNPVMNLAVRWRVDGLLTETDVECAWRQLISRHEALRTEFRERNGEPVMAIRPALAIRPLFVDLTGLEDAAATTEADRLALSDARTCFTLSGMPLIRITCLWMRGYAVLLVTLHRIVCDEQSLRILAHEMAQICSARRRGERAVLPPLSLRYEDQALRREAWLTSDDFRRSTTMYREALQGLTHTRLLPDHPPSTGRASNGVSVSSSLDAQLATEIAQFADRAQTTPFVTLLAALFVLLHRQTGETDLAVSTPLAGRVASEQLGLVGLLDQPTIIRIDVADDPTFLDTVARVSNMVSTVTAAGPVPFQTVADIIDPTRGRTGTALCSINVNLRQPSVEPPAYRALGMTEMPPCVSEAVYDLDVSFVEAPEGWRMSCIYDSGLFERATVAGLMNRFETLLRTGLGTPEQSVSLLPILDPAEWQALILDRNQTAAEYPSHLTVVDLFAEQVRSTPDATAVLCRGASLTFRELDGESDRLAETIRRRGWSPGHRIGVFLNRSPDLLVALLAILKSGNAYVPLDPTYPQDRIAYIAENASLAAVITRRSLRGDLPSGTTPVYSVDEDSAADDGSTGEAIENACATDRAAPDDLAYVIYTSGSTGRPKGVQIQHRALVNLLWAMREQPGLSAADTLLSVTTISFDIATLEMFLPLIVGARLVIATEDQAMDGVALLGLLRHHEATVMQATPVTWQILIEAGWQGDPPLKMLCGGEALVRPLANQLLQRGGELWNMYGPTETTIWSSALRVEPGDGPVPLGGPIANTEFYVLDRHRNPVAPGAPGELYIGGDGLALGYLDLPAMTRDRFVPDTFRSKPGARLYRTGDTVRTRPDGRLDYLGRGDQQIKLRGFRIELGEIEAVLSNHPDVADAVAVMRNDATGDPAICAYVVPRLADPNHRAALSADLRGWLGQFLPGYMHPSSVTFLPALPRTPNGKIDRKSLPAPDPSHPVSAAHGALLTDTERRIARIWRSVLNRDDLDPAANFFELGGHSILAARMLAQVETELRVRVSLAALFQAPTVRGLAQQVEQAGLREFDFRQVVHLQEAGSRQPLIAINNTGIFYPLARTLGRDQPFTALQAFDPSMPTALPHSLTEIAATYVELILQVQPKGPYALIGWCNAGTLAFEIGRQLFERTRLVPRIVLVDSWAPGHRRRLPVHRAALAACAYRGHKLICDTSELLSRRGSWGYRTRKLAADSVLLVSGRQSREEFLPRHQMVNRVVRWFHARKLTDGQTRTLAPGYRGAEDYDDWLTRHLDAAAGRFEPATYPAKILLLRPQREPESRFLDFALGWSEFAAGGITTAVVPGDHYSMFQAAGVDEMARHISALLSEDRSDRSAGSPP